jgi:hypothetical protein
MSDSVGRAAVISAVLATGLAGCGSVSERTLAGAFSSPGKYDVFTCQDVESYIKANQLRRIELEQLMSRASQSAGGEFVNTIAYRGEYAQAKGDEIELAKAKEEKRCAIDSKFSSGRSVF